MNFRAFFAVVFLVPLFFVADSGMRPWKDRRAIRFCIVLALAFLATVAVLYVLPGPLTLFEFNGIWVRIAKPETARHPYEPLHYPPPKNLDEYDNLGKESPSLTLEPACTQQSRWAILVHEPHGKVKDETGLFFFLLYLQHAYPSVFANMHVFQEGHPHAHDSSHPLLVPPRMRMDEMDIMVQDSYTAWKKNPDYSPLNTISNIVNSDERSKAVQTFLGKVGYNATNLDGRWAAAIPFYTPRTPNGALDLRQAMQNHLQTLIAKDSNTSQTQQLLGRVQSLQPGDARLAEWLITDMHLRGAFAYKLYIEGGSAAINTTSHESDTQFTVVIHGLEDFGLYFASCAAVPNCLGKDGFVPLFGPSWLKIQPYRDWVMARSALLTLDQLDKPGISVVPIIAANVATHLPLIREFFCRAGYNTVTLGPNPDWHSPKNWAATTPISDFHTRQPSAVPGAYRKMKSNIVDELMKNSIRIQNFILKAIHLN